MDGTFDMGFGGDSILSRLFGQNKYTPQTDALLAAPDTNSGGQMGGQMGAPGAMAPAPPMGNPGQMANALPMGDPSGLVAHTTTPNPPMGNGVGGLLGLDDDKMKRIMAAMQLMQNSQAQPSMQSPMNRPMQPQQPPQQFSSFGGMGQPQGQTSPQTQQLLNLLQMAGTRRF